MEDNKSMDLVKVNNCLDHIFAVLAKGVKFYVKSTVLNPVCLNRKDINLTIHILRLFNGREEFNFHGYPSQMKHSCMRRI